MSPAPPIFSGHRSRTARAPLPEGTGDVLVVRNVSAGYGPYRALFGVSFTVPAGGVVALIGSNGAGKSTVARTVSGLVTATEGQVVLGGVDVTRMPAWRIARLGMAHVVEGRGVFASLTVEENLVLAFRQRAGRRAVADSLARAYQAFPILGERRRQTAGTLSGGQQRLLSLAKVLVVPPKLLVADELSLGLAPVVIDAVYNGLEEINRNGTALLVVEQQVDRVLRISDKALVLDRGTVAFEGSGDSAAEVVETLLARRERAGSMAVAQVEEATTTGAAPEVAAAEVAAQALQEQPDPTIDPGTPPPAAPPPPPATLTPPPSPSPPPSPPSPPSPPPPPPSPPSAPGTPPV